MSKIICDVCGTSYPDTAPQCPICGCVRHVDRRHRSSSGVGENEAAESGSYTYVKGGRFSKSNVKRRSRPIKSSPVKKSKPPVAAPVSEEKEPSSKGLTIAVIALLLAIVAVVLYIMLHFFVPDLFTVNKDANNNETTGQSNTDGSDDGASTGIDCTGISLDVNAITLKEKNAAFLLNVTVTPDNTTCEIVYESSDESIATVTTGGKVTAVGEGEAIITVTCGDQQAECKVVCAFETSNPDNPDNPDDPDDPDDPVDPPVSVDGFAFNREDFSLLKDDETWKLYTGDVDVKQIAWRSDNENVATIQDGVVRATGNGATTVYAEYDGVVLDSCIVRCYNQNPDNNDQVAGAPDGSHISSVDVTVKVGETFNLYVYSAEGHAVPVEWTCDDNGCTASGNRITAVAAGTTEVYAEYNGYVHKCIVRVNAG